MEAPALPRRLSTLPTRPSVTAGLPSAALCERLIPKPASPDLRMPDTLESKNLSLARPDMPAEPFEDRVIERGVTVLNEGATERDGVVTLGVRTEGVPIRGVLTAEEPTEVRGAEEPPGDER